MRCRVEFLVWLVGNWFHLVRAGGAGHGYSKGELDSGSGRLQAGLSV